MGAFGALVLAASALALTASAASATMACHYPEGSNTCLTIEPLGNRYYAVKIGIDIYMTRQEAEALITWARYCWPQPCGLFSARLWGEDPGGDPGLFTVPVSWVAAWEGGLSAEFDLTVYSSRLNEDTDGRDEIYASVDMTDYRTGQRLWFTSGLVVGYY
jgi:hypothetical protein